LLAGSFDGSVVQRKSSLSFSSNIGIEELLPFSADEEIRIIWSKRKVYIRRCWI